MSEYHPAIDDLVAIALDDRGPAASTTLSHLELCSRCRTTYNEFQWSIDSILPATPALAPTAGFETRVLAQLRPRRGPMRRSAVLIVVAAAIGIVLGVVGVGALHNNSDSVASHVQVALVADGTPVGTVNVGATKNRSTVALHVANGPPGTHYTCQLTGTDGHTVDAGDWVIPASGRANWTVMAAPSDIKRVDLLTDDGQIWSSAVLP